MVVNLKFSRFNDTPWGFRLVGGTDFEVPLTVIKVNEGSLAEAAGLVEGDIIVRINETPTINLSHLDAHALLKKTGNNFMLGIKRENEPEEERRDTTRYSSSKTPEPLSSECRTSSCGNVSCQSSSESHEIKSENKTEIVEEHITDEVIAEIISSEAEVLKEHNIIGVNFKKIIPKSGHIKNSETWSQLNKEAMKTKEEWDKETKKWSTFLQKPDRPIPKPKNDIPLQMGYKVKIVKQPKPRCAPDRTPTPPPIPEPIVVEEEPLKEIQPITVEEPIENENHLVENITDDDVPDLNDTSSSRPETSMSNRSEITAFKDDEANNEENIEMAVTSEPAPQKTEEEIYLEKQLADVQQQLMALSNLPLTIQAALDEVTKKLSSIVPAISQVKERKSSVEMAAVTETEAVKPEENANEEVVPTENLMAEKQNQEILDSETETKELHETDETMEKADEETEEPESNVIVNDPDWEYKKHEEQQLNEELELEHQQRLIRERTPRRPAHHAFGPLTPQQRPISLPGGRKWRTPKDAFNEEFIAEVLSSQAELITGTTLGKSYESPLLPYDDRVNFLKYQKPEKKVNLEQSEVYRLIHHLDAEPKRGIEVRPEKVSAIQDIRVT